MNTTFTGIITTTCPCGKQHVSASTIEAQRWLRNHQHTKGWDNPMQISLHHPTPIVVPVPVKGAKFARITTTPNGQYVLRLVDGTADIVYRDVSSWRLRNYAESWFGCPLKWRCTDGGVLWVAP